MRMRTHKRTCSADAIAKGRRAPMCCGKKTRRFTYLFRPSPPLSAYVFLRTIHNTHSCAIFKKEANKKVPISFSSDYLCFHFEPPNPYISPLCIDLISFHRHFTYPPTPMSTLGRDNTSTLIPGYSEKIHLVSIHSAHTTHRYIWLITRFKLIKM
jgi:hypothetical protein